MAKEVTPINTIFCETPDFMVVIVVKDPEKATALGEHAPLLTQSLLTTTDQEKLERIINGE